MRQLLLLAALAILTALSACSGSEREKTCAAGETLCDGRCTSTQIDSAHCGACGTACGAFQECDAGTCACGPGTVECGGTCADLTTDPDHCGACDVVCGSGQVCAAPGGVAACAGACPAGQVACGRSCVDLATDRWSCGACGNRCDRGESCREGSCRPDLFVACFATDDVRPANAALRAGLPRAAGDGPIALAISGGKLWAAASISHSLVSFPLDLGAAGTEVLLGGKDLEAITAAGQRLYVSNAGTGTLVVYDTVQRRVVDELVLGPAAGLNPRGVAFVGDRGYVALYGTDATSGGQEVVVLDGGIVTRRIDLRPLADEPGLPFPFHPVAVGTRVYVTLANLKLGSAGFFTDPAGGGKLAVIDTAAGDALSVVDLGDACQNPGGLAEHEGTLWVACGATGALVPVDVSGAAPVVGEAVATGAQGVYAPGNIAFCGGIGYLTDQWSGSVLRFDPAGLSAPVAGEICPLAPAPASWAWAADVACAP
jgi:DNA-binding beta-propeller fold protein YncE